MIPPKRRDKREKKAIVDMLFLTFVAAGMLAVIVIGGILVPLKINEIINIRSKLSISVTNDYAVTEIVTLLNNKAGNVKYVELIGSYMAEGMEDNTEYIQPFQDTLNTVYRKYDFAVTGTNIDFKKDVPAEFQDSTRISISNCETSLPQDIKKEDFNFIWPSESKTISSGFGGRDLKNNGVCSCHPGIDISGGGNKVFAAADGTILSTYTTCIEGQEDCNSGYGNYIVIKHTISGKNYYTYYDHLKSVLKTSGAVKAGEEIGISGNTGYSTGPHLHFELRSAGQQRLKDSIVPCELFADKSSVPSNCIHEQVAACAYVSGKDVRSYQTDIPLPGPRTGANIRGQVVFKQWS